MSQKSLNHAQAHPNDEVATPDSWFKNMEEKGKWKEKGIFKGKTILLPCDDIEWSGMAKYFIPRFEELGIEKLIFRSYNPDGAGKVFIKTKEGEEQREAEGHGDFREEEAKRFRDEADLIVTNPPYSIKLDYYNFSKCKPFITVFPVTILNRASFFEDLQARRIFYNDNILPHYSYPMNTLTNIKGLLPTRPFPKHEKTDKAGEYQKYDDYDAIHISRLQYIPEHCSKLMGVPATIFQYDYDDKYEVLDLLHSPTINGKEKYSRILIKEKQ